MPKTDPLPAPLQHNIDVLAQLREEADRTRSVQDRAADALTRFSGSMTFLYLHTAWFGIWITVNMGWIPEVKGFDPFPFGLLTMIVSLEAIFLSTVVLISQNREAQLNSRKESLDLQIDLLSEYEVTRSLRLLRKIAIKLEIEDDPEMCELCDDIAPAKIMHQIQQRIKD